MNPRLPPPGHDVDNGHCLCGADVPDAEANAHYYHVSSSTFKVCPHDGAPVVSDYSRPGREWRCPDCSRFYPFLGSCPNVPSTHALALRFVAAIS